MPASVPASEPVTSLPVETFRTIIQFAPLISIDLLLSTPDDRYLMGLRNNEPAKGTWFVPGGRIRKGETLERAFSRILHQETGLDMPMSDGQFYGVFEHIYSTNTFDAEGFGTHYIVLAYKIKIPDASAIRFDNQHSQVTWKTPAEILSAPNVHDNTKAYFTT